METKYKFNIGDSINYKGEKYTILKRFKGYVFNHYYFKNQDSFIIYAEEKDLELYQETNKTMAQKAFTTRTITFSSGDELKLSQAQNNNNLISFSFKVNNRPVYLELTLDDCLELTRQVDSYVEEVEENNEMKYVDELNNE